MDTGIIIGYADKKDLNFHKPCSDFVEKYRFKTNKYYSNINVINTEVLKKERERSKIQTKHIFRLFIERAKIFRDHLIDASYEGHGLFNDLFNEMHLTLVKYGKPNHEMTRDAKLLTSSFLWDYEQEGLCTPHFLTTDYHDIYKNRDEIEKKANLHLPFPSGIIIEFIQNMI